MKFCSKCNTEKHEDDFSKNKNKPDGLQIWCKDCYKLLNNGSYRTGKRKQQVIEANRRGRQIRREFVSKFKLDKGCKYCGYNKHACALDLHHTKDKVCNVANMVNKQYKLKTIEEEISKCEVVCANCHRVITFTDVGVD